MDIPRIPELFNTKRVNSYLNSEIEVKLAARLRLFAISNFRTFNRCYIPVHPDLCTYCTFVARSASIVR